MSQPETNELQRLIASYLAANPGENYATIARRARMSRSTVFAIATRPRMRQTPHPDTIAALARGMQMPESRVRVAAGLAAGFGGSPGEVWVALVDDEASTHPTILGATATADQAKALAAANWESMRPKKQCPPDGHAEEDCPDSTVLWNGHHFPLEWRTPRRKAEREQGIERAEAEMGVTYAVSRHRVA